MKIENGNTVAVHFIGTFDNGEEFDNSLSRGEPVVCEVGSQSLIKGFNDALVGMTLGETKSISLSPEYAYGERSEEAVKQVSRGLFGPDFELKEGATVYGKNDQNQELMAKICEFDSENVTLDFNHPMAGKNLNFEITVVDIEE